jgi:hypothetical protein
MNINPKYIDYTKLRLSNEALDVLKENFELYKKCDKSMTDENFNTYYKKYIELFMKYGNKKIDDTVLWPTIYKKCMKYKPFFHYDMFKCRKILKDKFA